MCRDPLVFVDFIAIFAYPHFVLAWILDYSIIINFINEQLGYGLQQLIKLEFVVVLEVAAMNAVMKCLCTAPL